MENVRTMLGNLKSKVDKLGVGKLVPVPVDLSKLSDVVENVVRKDVMLSLKILKIKYLILLILLLILK